MKRLTFITGIATIFTEPALFYLLNLGLLTACNNGEPASDAYGNFEATEVEVAAEVNGKLLEFEVEEGQTLQKDEIIGFIDTTQLHLQKEQLKAKRASIAAKTSNVLAQIDVLKEQLKVLQTDKQRTENLLKDQAATPKQLDDINGQISVTKSQIKSIRTQNISVLSEIKATDAQIAQIEDQIEKSILKNPVKGTVLVKFAEPSEFAAIAKPLYRIADLDHLYLRAYVTGAQLPHLKIGEEVKVLIDENRTENQALSGTVSWISDEAEFTPKIIQTKEERVNLVYAFKVRVPNDGSIKIGMPGEVQFTNVDLFSDSEK